MIGRFFRPTGWPYNVQIVYESDSSYFFFCEINLNRFQNWDSISKSHCDIIETKVE